MDKPVDLFKYRDFEKNLDKHYFKGVLDTQPTSNQLWVEKIS